MFDVVQLDLWRCNLKVNVYNTTGEIIGIVQITEYDISCEQNSIYVIEINVYKFIFPATAKQNNQWTQSVKKDT